MDFAKSQTCEALMRAFAGECQAHTRYLLAAKSAAAQQLHVLRQAFEFTAKQELIHAQLFAQRLQQQGKGDLFVTVNVEVPKRISQQERALMEQLAALQGQPVVQKNKKRPLKDIFK